MKILKLNSLFLLVFFINACAQNNNLQKTNHLIGTWKVEGKESYEEWSKSGDILTGKAYKIKDGKKIVSEKLEIKTLDQKVIYTATVLNQNNGKGIPFTLNTSIKEQLSFENLNHDFPKKIQYKQLDTNKLLVSVLGKDDKGFSYKLTRQNN